jgi:multidrug resistance efflux pump
MVRKVAFIFVLIRSTCSWAAQSAVVRATGLVQAVHAVTVQVPRIEGQGGNITLAKLVPNGVTVHQGDLLAEFDRTAEAKTLLDVQSKFDDLTHQVEQKIAEQKSNAEKRASDLQQAESDLKKARIEMRKGPILSTIEQEKNKAKLDDAQIHVASLQKSNHFHELAEAAELRVLELQRDRQKIAVERQNNNMRKLTVNAPLQGMVALQNVYRNQSMGHAQEGDQLWPGSALLQLFDPGEMEVDVDVGEPDGAVLVPGAKAIVHLDAFPDLTFTAHFESASPVATSGMDSSVQTFSARFRLDQRDAHLMPDLSAALDIQPPTGAHK